jgi:SAM-dependent methyltransferase
MWAILRASDGVASSPLGFPGVTLAAMPTPLEALSEDYASWWIDFLGEHNHVGGLDATRWLLERARLAPGDRMLDCGAFVGAAARLAAAKTGASTFACDINPDFLIAGRQLEGGSAVTWVVAGTERLPFRDATFASVWCLDTYIAPRELSRVAAARSTLCLCCEVPVDARGGVEAFIGEWAEFGWGLAAHRQMSSEATQTWRMAEAEMAGKRHQFEKRYGARGYLAQLDMLANMVHAYERGEMGHGLFVFARG